KEKMGMIEGHPQEGYRSQTYEEPCFSDHFSIRVPNARRMILQGLPMSVIVFFSTIMPLPLLQRAEWAGRTSANYTCALRGSSGHCDGMFDRCFPVNAWKRAPAAHRKARQGTGPQRSGVPERSRR